MTILPQFPAPVESVGNSSTLKFPMETLEYMYDLLTSAGLFVVAKRIDSKLPVGTWGNYTPENYSRSTALAQQGENDASGWCVITGFNRAVVVDLDLQTLIDNGRNPADVYNEIQAISPTPLVLRTPTNGVHLYYRVADGLKLLKTGTNLYGAGVDIRCVGGQVVSLGGFNHYAGEDAINKGVPDGHTLDYALLPDGDYTRIPEMSQALYDQLPKADEKTILHEPKLDGNTTVYRAEAKESWKNQKRSKSKHDLGIVYATAILNHLVRKNQRFDYDTWLKFRVAYQDFTGASEEAFEAMVTHPYWQAEWDENAEHHKWMTDEPRKWDDEESDKKVEGWYLVWLARSLGVFAYNPVDLKEPYVTISDMNELPQGSYLLAADTGTGKTEAQNIAIKRVLDAGKRVILVVNTRQLAHAAQGRFKHFEPVHYTDERGKRISTDELKRARFLIVVAQSFARWVITYKSDAKNTALVIFDEIQQQTASAHKQHGVGDVWSDKQQREFDNAVRLLIEAGTEIHGLDAGINEQTRARFPSIPVVRYDQRIKRAPVTIYSNPAHVLDLLVIPRKGLTVVATDTQGGNLGSENLANLITQTVEGAIVLRLDSDTIDPKSRNYNPNAVAFMRDPDTLAPMYTHIVYSPTALSGLSVQFPATVLLQFATFLTPKDNQQMKARFRNVGSVHAYYQNARKRTIAVTPDQAWAKAKALIGDGLVKRNDVAMSQEQIRYLGELDELYQSLSPRDMYVSLLEKEGCKVTLDTHEATRRKLDKPEDVDYTDYENEHWHEQPDEPEDISAMTNEDYAAWRYRQHILKTVGQAAIIPDIVPDTVGLAVAARGVSPYQVKNLALIAGVEGDAAYTFDSAISENVPPTHIRAYAQRLALLVSLSVLGYSGEDTIAAECWRDNGQAAFDFLYKQRELWDASVPADKRWARLTDRTDAITALRSMVKHMLTEWLGLEVSQGKNTRVLNPLTDAQIRNLDVAGWGSLYDLLYVYEHSLRNLTKREESIVKLSKVVFTEKAARVELEAQADFLEWFNNQTPADRELAIETFRDETRKGNRPSYANIKQLVAQGVAF